MAFKKGESGNPGGRGKAQAMLLSRVQRAGPRAVDRMIATIDSADERLAFDASKYIYEILNGKPRAQTNVEVTHEIGGRAAHLYALREHIDVAKHNLNPDKEAKALISLPNSGDTDKQAINVANVEDAIVINNEE